jgi:hypothetical protein
MSIEAMVWALNAPLNGTQKVLLIGLANHATAEFDNARPAVSTLAQYANCHERNVQKGLRQLEADGWIEKVGAHAVEGRHDRLVSVYRICRDRGVEIAAPSENGVASGRERGGDSAANGVASAPPKPSLLTVQETVPKDLGGADELWRHYQEVRRAWNPRSTGCKLGPAEKRLIKGALAVRELEDCKLAVTGLFRSDYHVQHGYIGLKYALLGGGRAPDPATTIDRLAHTAQNGNGNGNGRLKGATFSGGRSWDELTPNEQAVAKENASMGIFPEDRTAASSPAQTEAWNGGEALTAENF